MNDLTLVFKALCDPKRFEIIQMLSNKEKCACQILEKFEITQSTLSHHMKILNECNLVQTRKDGKWNYYTLNLETLNLVSNFFNNLSKEDLI